MESRWYRSTFPTRRHERVHGLLSRLVSEGTAHFFADACDISQRRPPYRTTSHITGHLVREVEGAILDVLVSLPEVKSRLAESPTNKNHAHLAKVDAILHVLKLDNNDVAANWRVFVGNKGGWHRDAHRDTLQLPREIDDEFASRLDLFVDVITVVLDAAEANFAAVIRAISEVCAKAIPSSADLDFVAWHLAPGVAAVSHVFAGLTAAWLVPLRERRVFDAPPDVLFHEGGSYSFPHWPQAGYLERMASELPEDVAATIERVPLNDNESIHWAFLRTALRMPPAQARRVSAREIPWLGSRPWREGPLPNAVQKLALHLIEGNEIDGAFQLLAPAFALLVGDDEEVSWRERRARMSDWDFEELVRDTIGALAERDAARTKAFLFERLDEGQKDESSWWRQAVEDHGQNRFSEPLDHMFVELRKIFERDIERGGEPSLRAAVLDLEGRSATIYSRLALHLLRRFGSLAPDLVLERATDQTRLDSVAEFHEIASMIGDQFSGLRADAQQCVVTALRENSSIEHVRGRYTEQLLKADELAQHADLQRRQWFAILGAHRPSEVAEEYQALCVGRGEPEHPTFSSWHGAARSGPNPPVAMPELLAMEDEELLQFLHDWVPPSRDRFEASRSGLGRELKKCVIKDTARFSRLARKFRTHHPQYVGNVLWGLREASRPADDSSLPAGDILDWDSVLDLAEWVTQQKSEGSDYEDENPRAWTWARQGAVDVAQNLTVVNVAGTGTGDHLPRAWSIIKRLLVDADPTSERVAETKLDDDTFWINSVRGQAVHAAISLAGTLAQTNEHAGLLEEVLREVEARGNAEIEPCRAIRGVLAQHFTNLFLVSKALAGRIAEAIFPSVSRNDQNREVMWQTFLRWNRSAGDLFAILREPYSASVCRLGAADEKTWKSVAEHLIWLAAGGVPGAALPDGLVVQFVKLAPMSVRHHALETIGRAIHHEETPLPHADSERLKALWSWWSSEQAGADLAAFGWWMSGPAFDAPWRLSTLPRVLEATGGELDWDQAACETLASLAEGSPREVAHCLARVVESDASHRIRRCMNAIRKTLEALRPGPAGAIAREIAARLVARKYPEFSDLM